MLAEGEPVIAVAHRCGWSSTSAFIDVFRRAVGATPGEHSRRQGLSPRVLPLSVAGTASCG